jgi:hypothetical protein
MINNKIKNDSTTKIERINFFILLLSKKNKGSGRKVKGTMILNGGNMKKVTRKNGNEQPKNLILFFFQKKNNNVNPIR